MNAVLLVPLVEELPWVTALKPLKWSHWSTNQKRNAHQWFSSICLFIFLGFNDKILKDQINLFGVTIVNQFLFNMVEVPLQFLIHVMFVCFLPAFSHYINIFIKGKSLSFLILIDCCWIKWKFQVWGYSWGVCTHG